MDKEKKEGAITELTTDYTNAEKLDLESGEWL